MHDQLKLAVVGDPHCAIPHGDPDPYLEADPGRKLHGWSVELLAETIREVNAQGDIAAALVLGDLTRDSEEFNHEVARGLLSLFEMPYYLVFGNHDLRRWRPEGKYYPQVNRFDREQTLDFYRDRGFPSGSSRYAVELPGGVLLIVLDSNRTLAELQRDGTPVDRQDDGAVDESQLAWLRQVLARARLGGALPLVAIHHSIAPHSPAEQPKHMLYTAFRSWMLDQPKHLVSVLAEFEVPLVLSGHLHAQSVNVTQGVYNLVTAASVSYPHAWRTLTVAGGAIHVESHPLASIPSCPNLQDVSRKLQAEGMAELVRRKVQQIPLVSGIVNELSDFVTSTGWWPRFCDGTLAGFTVSLADHLAQRGKITEVGKMASGQLERVLNDYGRWKAERPDPNTLIIPVVP